MVSIIKYKGNGGGGVGVSEVKYPSSAATAMVNFNLISLQ